MTPKARTTAGRSSWWLFWWKASSLQFLFPQIFHDLSLKCSFVSNPKCKASGHLRGIFTDWMGAISRHTKDNRNKQKFTSDNVRNTARKKHALPLPQSAANTPLQRCVPVETQSPCNTCISTWAFYALCIPDLHFDIFDRTLLHKMVVKHERKTWNDSCTIWMWSRSFYCDITCVVFPLSALPRWLDLLPNQVVIWRQASQL